VQVSLGQLIWFLTERRRPAVAMHKKTLKRKAGRFGVG